MLAYFSGLHFSLGGVSPQHMETHKHRPIYYGIQYNHSGKIYVRKDNGARFEGEGAYAFISHPEAFFEYGSPDDSPRSHNFVCFCGERVRSYIEGGLLCINPENPLIKVENPIQFHKTLLELIYIINNSPTLPERAVLMLEELLLSLHEHREVKQTVPVYYSLFFQDLIEDIKKKPQLSWNFESEAEKINVTATHFRRLFKTACGMSPQQFLIQARLRMAADLLIHKRETAGRIAEAVGIDNEFYFSKLFKSKYNVTPMQYRKEFRFGKTDMED